MFKDVYKRQALGFLVGQAMKETKGKANPQMLNKMFLDCLLDTSRCV